MKLILGVIIVLASFNSFALSIVQTTTDSTANSLFSQLGHYKLEANQIKAEYQEYTVTGVMPKFLSEKVEALQMIDSSLDEVSALEEVVTKASEF